MSFLRNKFRKNKIDDLLCFSNYISRMLEAKEKDDLVKIFKDYGAIADSPKRIVATYNEQTVAKLLNFRSVFYRNPEGEFPDEYEEMKEVLAPVFIRIVHQKYKSNNKSQHKYIQTINYNLKNGKKI